MLKKHSNKCKLLVVFLLVICSTLLIIINSLMDFETSHNTSEIFASTIAPENHQNFETIELIIRKIAHVIEYAFLGIAVMIAAVYVRQNYYKVCSGAACFYVLALAVIDEHIQSFSDRTSSTSDIILDFCGALLGFFIAWLLIKVYKKLKKTQKENLRKR